MAKRSRKPGSTPAGRQTRGGARNAPRIGPAADMAIFAAVTLVVSALLFAITQGPTVRAGCVSISMGPFALAIGVIAAARGLAWRDKWRPLLILVTTYVVIVLLAAPTWFGVYRLGDVSTAPQTLSLTTAVPFLFFAAFIFFLPWAVPIGVLLVAIGRDPRKLWSSGGRG